MNITDILRTLIDKLEQIENDHDDADVLSNNDVEDNNNEKMMPPLQQKQELLKKAVGVDSEYDDNSDDSCEPDIERLRKNAGISIQYLSDDEPLEQ